MSTRRPPWPLLAIIALCLTPFLLGGGLYASGWRPEAPRIHGQLLPASTALPPITPISPIAPGTTQLMTQANTQQAAGRWLLLVASAAPCAAACASLAERLRVVRIALNKQMGRVQRLVLTPAEAAELSALRHRQPDLDVVSAPEWIERLAPGEEPAIFIIDPQGMPVLRYAASADLAGIHRDLARLLKYAWNG